jgi:hypothetical protein
VKVVTFASAAPAPGHRTIPVVTGSPHRVAPGPVGQVTPPAVEAAAHRLAWIDNLRVAVIVGVIGAHVSLIYALDVGWYYQERTASTVAKAVLAAAFAPGLLFGMGLLFFVAGLVTPPAIARKGPRRFAVDRLWRLGIPIVAYVFVLNPLLNFLGDHAMGYGETVDDYFRRTYWDDVEFGIAWFIFALLLFSLAWAAWRAHRPAPAGAARPLHRHHLMWTVVVIAVASFVLRLVWPFLATGDLIGLNLWEYPQMASLFVLGALAEERGWLVDGLSPDLRRRCGRAAALGAAIAVVIAVSLTITDEPDPFLGGLRPEAVLIPVAEGVISVGATFWLTDWCRRRWNRTGRVARAAARASFAAYLLHPLVADTLAMAMRGVGIPAELKFAVVFGLAVFASFGLGWAVTRSRTSSRVL